MTLSYQFAMSDSKVQKELIAVTITLLHFGHWVMVTYSSNEVPHILFKNWYDNYLITFRTLSYGDIWQ